MQVRQFGRQRQARGLQAGRQRHPAERLAGRPGGQGPPGEGGHQLALGLLRQADGNGFPDGNNQESTGEAVNSWAGMILLGEALGEKL